MKVRITIIPMSFGGKRGGKADKERPNLSYKNPSFTGNIQCNIPVMNSDKPC